MDEIIRCQACGLAYPTEGPGGLCPRCMLLIGLEAESFDPEDEPPDAAGGRGDDEEPARFQPAAARLGSPIVILNKVARGGMGVIFRGHDSELDREVAVKVLRAVSRPARDGRPVHRGGADRRALQHPGLVPIFERGWAGDGRPYYAMKLVRGKTLAEMLADRATERDRLLDVFLRVSQTIAYAHRNGVAHRDLTPANVMVGEYGEVQVMDWGLAKVSSSAGPSADEAGGDGEAGGPAFTVAAMGTPGYMAPEQAAGVAGPRNECVDVFALGSILCEILTGLPAFHGGTSRATQEKARRADLSEAMERLAACGGDGELTDLARDCLAADPSAAPARRAGGRSADGLPRRGPRAAPTRRAGAGRGPGAGGRGADPPAPDGGPGLGRRPAPGRRRRRRRLPRPAAATGAQPVRRRPSARSQPFGTRPPPTPPANRSGGARPATPRTVPR